MEETVRALLCDTRSIQRYIYAGNRLKTNVGASFLVTTVFEEELFPVVREAFGDAFDEESFAQGGAPVEALAQGGRAVVAANGGGNALVLFSADVTEETLRGIVRSFSERVLASRPGLHLGAAIGELRTAPAFFQEDLSALFGKLKENQNRVFPQVNVPYHGITVSCQVNGEAANFFDAHQEIRPDAPQELRFYSQETAAKARAAKRATAALHKMFSSITERYAFPLEIGELGQRETENFFAIVHIDGNNMGERFRACRTQDARSRLSRSVQKKTEGAFHCLLESIDAEYGSYAAFLDLGTADGKPVLPIRPIILGGDDVTFVCPAKLALRFAKRFLEAMADPAAVDKIEAEEARVIDACAGIAIVKTTYPFFRGYELAEQLCDAAKARMRTLRAEGGAGTSWLDYAILHGEQAPTLAALRAQEYHGARGDMHFGPYRVAHPMGTGEKEHRYDIENLALAVRQLQGTKDAAGRWKTRPCMARSKAKELRGVLAHGAKEAQRFRLQLDHMGDHLPDVAEWAVYAKPENALWSGAPGNERTPYVDAIELMEFLPEEAE